MTFRIWCSGSPPQYIVFWLVYIYIYIAVSSIIVTLLGGMWPVYGQPAVVRAIGTFLPVTQPTAAASAIGSKGLMLPLFILFTCFLLCRAWIGWWTSICGLHQWSGMAYHPLCGLNCFFQDWIINQWSINQWTKLIALVFISFITIIWVVFILSSAQANSQVVTTNTTKMCLVASINGVQGLEVRFLNITIQYNYYNWELS